MKTLQNNFTTPEQSQRLLELGVSADSADCFFMTSNPGEEQFPNIIPIVDDGKICFSLFCDERAVPCWSVGRLIEIIVICREEIHTRLLFSRVDDHTNIENLIHYISTEIVNGHMDFSKLEE